MDYNEQWFLLEMATTEERISNTEPGTKEHEDNVAYLKELQRLYLELQRFYLDKEKNENDKKKATKALIADGLKAVMSGTLMIIALDFERAHSIATKTWNAVSGILKIK